MERIPFTESTRAQVKADAEIKGLQLVEEQNHIDGDFFLYGTPDEVVKIEKAKAKEALACLDKDMARAAEDIYNALIIKNILQESDFPAEVVSKIQDRAALRSKL
jgi:hypothetical protein